MQWERLLIARRGNKFFFNSFYKELRRKEVGCYEENRKQGLYYIGWSSKTLEGAALQLQMKAEKHQSQEQDGEAGVGVQRMPLAERTPCAFQEENL